ARMASIVGKVTFDQTRPWARPDDRSHSRSHIAWQFSGGCQRRRTYAAHDSLVVRVICDLRISRYELGISSTAVLIVATATEEAGRHGGTRSRTRTDR